jgi:hypothetical protein
MCSMLRNAPPALHFPHHDDPAAWRHASRVLDHLASAGLVPATPAALLAGASGVGDVSLSVSVRSMEALVGWLDTLAPTASSALAAIPSDVLDVDEALAEALPLIAGLGLVTASAGTSGEPLWGMGVARMRQELRGSRERLEDVCGHAVRTLVLASSRRGFALDALVLEEARAAGYETIRAPGFGPDAVWSRLRGIDQVVRVRQVHAADRAAELARWVAGGERWGAQVEGALLAALAAHKLADEHKDDHQAHHQDHA